MGSGAGLNTSSLSQTGGRLVADEVTVSGGSLSTNSVFLQKDAGTDVGLHAASLTQSSAGAVLAKDIVLGTGSLNASAIVLGSSDAERSSAVFAKTLTLNDASASLRTASAPLNLTLHAGGLLNVEKGSLFLGSMDSPSGSIEIARDATATFTNLSLKSASDFAAYTGSAVDGRVGVSGTLHVGTLNLGNGGTSTADGTIHATTLATEKTATLASGTYTIGNAVQGDFVLNNT